MRYDFVDLDEQHSSRVFQINQARANDWTNPNEFNGQKGETGVKHETLNGKINYRDSDGKSATAVSSKTKPS